MSRALARDQRVTNDAYYTPDDVAVKCVSVLAFAHAARVLEPSVGGGAFARAVKARGCHVTGVDINTQAAGFADCHERGFCDFGATRLLDGVPFDWIIGNPPYSHAQDHVEKALHLEPRCGVAFLLRLNFLEGQKRRAFWDSAPLASVHVLSKRPSFTGGGTDATAYAFFVWKMGWGNPPTLGWL